MKKNPILLLLVLIMLALGIWLFFFSDCGCFPWKADSEATLGGF